MTRPFDPPVRLSERAPPASQPQRPPPSGSPGGAKVLIVDDEPSVGRSLGRLLRGHAVTLASSVVEAEALLGADSFDVIFCDLMMPGLTGMDLYERIHHRDPALAESIVFISGGAINERTQSFLERIPNQRLDKPFEAIAVREVVTERLRRASAA